MTYKHQIWRSAHREGVAEETAAEGEAGVSKRRSKNHPSGKGEYSRAGQGKASTREPETELETAWEPEVKEKMP